MPVLVDFGFAERYDVNSPEAFHSNLSYGTPEVCLLLSPSNCLIHMADSALLPARILLRLYARSDDA